MKRLADKLALTADEIADGILELACAHLAEAVRKVTTGQGRDPANFTLFCFGGAGPLMACQVADKLAMETVLIPACAGVLSAWGALSAPWEREWTQTVPPDDRLDLQAHTAYRESLKRKALNEFETSRGLEWTDLAERRYVGQGETLVSAPELDFHRLHQQRFGFSRPTHTVETTQLRLRARRPPLDGVELSLTQAEIAPLKVATVRWKGESIEVSVLSAPGDAFEGPALVLQSGSTLFVAPGWRAKRTAKGHLILTRGGP